MASANCSVRGSATQIRRAHFPLFQHQENRLEHPIRRGVLTEMSQHQDAGENQRRGIGDSLARDVWRRAVDSLENGVRLPDVGRRYHAQPPHQTPQRSETMSP